MRAPVPTRIRSTNKQHYSLLPFNPISSILLPLEFLGASAPAPPWPGSTIPQALKLPSKVLAEVLHCSGQPLAHRHHRDNQAFITLGRANKTTQSMLRWNKQQKIYHLPFCCSEALLLFSVVQNSSIREAPTKGLVPFTQLVKVRRGKLVLALPSIRFS